MAKCSFCDIEIRKSTGKMLVKNSGKIFFFCTNKCEKNMFKLKRKPIKTKWTGLFHKEKKASKK